MNDLIIVGAGGLGREVATMIDLSKRKIHICGFADDDEALHGTKILGRPVLGDLSRLKERSESFVLAIGAASVRKTVAQRLKGIHAAQPLIEDDVPMHETIQIGEGSILCRGVTPTVDVSVGSHVYINLHCTIGHDAKIGDFSAVHPGVHISGNVIIGKAVEIGTGAVILPGVRVGDNTTIGAGAVVTKDVPAGQTVVGVPARSASS